MAIAPRHSAAVSALALQGDESVLEIGCGHGVAVRLVLERLTSGRITALDRSQKMIDMVAASLPDALAEGRLRPRPEALEAADFGGESFDAIFAVNLDFNLRLGTRPGFRSAARQRQGSCLCRQIAGSAGSSGVRG